MSTWRTRIAVPLAMVAVLGTTVPAAAQFSDSYKFIKAVKDKDGGAATKILDTPGSTFVNVRDGGDGDTALLIVVKRRDLSWVGFMLQRGANPNLADRDGSTPLLLAATTGFSEAVKTLLLVKAQVDVANRLGETALIKAVQARDEASVKLLLDAGASPDRTDNTGGSARTYAAADTRGGPVARMLKAAPAPRSSQMQGPSL